MSIDLSRACDLVWLAIEKARADYGKPVCVAVCDPAGFLLAFQRADGAPLRSIAIAQGKAYSAALMQMNTSLLLDRLHREKIALTYFCDHRLTALPGGSVITDAAGAIVGAIGVSGLAPYEDLCLSRDRDKTYSRGVISQSKSDQLSTGIAARWRSIKLSPVETSCTTQARPASRSVLIDFSNVGVFIAVSR
jgi:glc operon protein GlcG